MSPQDTPTDDIRWWSGLAHSVVEYTGPKPFGMDGSVCLWLHERSATQLLDMCDELDAKFSDLKNENEKLRELLQRSITTHDEMCTQRRNCFGCKFFGDFVCEPIKVSQEAEKMGVKVSK